MLEWFKQAQASVTGGLGGSVRPPGTASSVEDLAERQREERRLSDIRQFNRAVAVVLAFSAVVLLYTGWRAARVGPVFLWAIASIAAGGAVGFLFGIPRAGSGAAPAVAGSTTPAAPAPQPPSADAAAPTPPAPPAAPPPTAAAPAGGGLRPNTNLEEVSDWLTKIIVGLSLVHLKDLGDIVSATAKNAAAAFATKPTGSHESLATALIVGFAIEGFFLGYIYTRLFLQVAFARSDTDLQASSRAELKALVAKAPAGQIGQTTADAAEGATPAASLPSREQKALAEQVRRLAIADPNAPIEMMEALARDYEQTRSSMDSSPERTQKMQDIVSRMTVVALGAEAALDRLTTSSRHGDRLAAVVILKLRFNPKYTDWLAQRLVDEPPFVGFQAASALLAALRMGGAAEQEAVRTAVTQARDTLAARGWLNDPPRDRLIEQVLARPTQTAPAPTPAPPAAEAAPPAAPAATPAPPPPAGG